jgi:hypothetical protein
MNVDRQAAVGSCLHQCRELQARAAAQRER